MQTIWLVEKERERHALCDSRFRLNCDVVVVNKCDHFFING